MTHFSPARSSFLSKAFNRKTLTGVISVAALFCLSGTASARRTHTRTHSRIHALSSAMLLPLLTPGVVPDSEDAVPTDGKEYSLRLAAMHTGENIDIVYRIGDTYIPAAMDKLNEFLRDHRTNEVTHYDPKEFDLLHNLMTRLGRPNGVVDIVCGYRTAETNELLREREAYTGVAEHSQHILGHAIDIRVPGVGTAQVRNAALSLDAGGVGYYPTSQFVHVDVGPVREWTYGARTRRVRSRRRGHRTVRHHRG